jgi:hypothetical protein
VWIALDHGLKQAADLARILPELQALIFFTRDLQQRLGTVGVDGISGALGLHRLLTDALDGVPAADIARALTEVEALAESLRRYADVLGRLQALRATLV